MGAKPPEPAGTAPRVPMPEEARPEPVQPVFEVVIPSALAGVTTPAYHFKFWADGKTEGFDALAATRRMVVVNRIPDLLDMVSVPIRGFADDLENLVNSLAGEAATPNDPLAKKETTT